MMLTTVYKTRLRRSSRSTPWPQPLASHPTMPRRSDYSDYSSPCGSYHCSSRRDTCASHRCRSALASRLDRRNVEVNTWKNKLYPRLDNIDLIKKDIRRCCDRSAWHGREITRAYSRFAAAMNCAVPQPRCRCRACSIVYADQKIKLLKTQYAEAERWLEALKRHRWQYDLASMSVVANVGR